MRKKYFSLLLAGFLCSMSAAADEVVVGGIRYDLNTEAKDAAVLSLEDAAMKSVTIPERVTNAGVDYTVTSIAEKAFWDNATLTSVTMPNTVTTMGKNVFTYCKKLASVTLSNSLTSIESGTFTNCKSLKWLAIPASVKTIGSCAFMNCTALQFVYLPEGVETVESGAFAYCAKITSVSLPASLTKIGDEAFAGCIGIKDVYCLGAEGPQLGNDVFAETYIDKANLHVPDESVDSYKSAAQWGDFSAVDVLATGVQMITNDARKGARKYIKDGKVVIVKDGVIYRL